jgi:AcrR family transcriptional regulator
LEIRPSKPEPAARFTPGRVGVPCPIEFKTFVQQVNDCKRGCCLEFFGDNRQAFHIKKEQTIAKNLERIFDAALKISNAKGFNAMSMRELSRQAHLSIGALYNYFSSKEELLDMMQRQRRTITRRILTASIAAQSEPVGRLRAAIRTHLYLSEVMQPWFYFSYMEAKNLGERQRRAAVESELGTEQQFTDILIQGRDQGVFAVDDCQLTASLIKALLQDWYLKRSKYARRRIDVEHYARFLIGFLEIRLLVGSQAQATPDPFSQTEGEIEEKTKRGT